MSFYRFCLFILIATTSHSLFAQEANSKIYIDTNGQIYVKVDAPIYFFVSPNNESNNKVLIPSSDSLANPMYFDGPGKHYFVYNNKGERIRYLILADAKGPKPKLVEKEEFTTIKLTGDERVPLQFFLWVQLKEAAAYDTRMKITIKAELNMMMKMMLGKKLEEGVNALAEGIAKAFNAI